MARAQSDKEDGYFVGVFFLTKKKKEEEGEASAVSLDWANSCWKADRNLLPSSNNTDPACAGRRRNSKTC